jgi:ectoine hydroxylase
MTLTDMTDISTADPYPTRISGEPELVERTEPTVWSTGRTGPIDSATLAGHDTRGCSIHPDLLSEAEVAAFRADLEALAADPALGGDERLVVENDEVRTIFAVHQLSELVGELVRDPRVLDRARQILGSDVYVHQSRATFLPAFEGRGHYWHSDFETWHAEDGMPRPRAVSMWLTLTDYDSQWGSGLMLMPGSQRTFVPCVGGTPPEHYRSAVADHEIGLPSTEHLTNLASAYGIDQFTGAAGTALLLDANLMHGSANNITPFAREHLFVVFNSVENVLVEPFAGTERRPEHMASRDDTPLRRT